MEKQNSNNQTNGQSASNLTSDNKPTMESAPTADKPTPVSSSTQQFGNQAGESKQGQSPKEELKEAGREVVDEAKSAVDNATREVKSQANEIRRDAQDQATNLLNEQKDAAAQRVGGVADALRQAGQGLADHDEEMLAHYTDSLAGQLDNFSSTLRDREIGSLVEDAKQLAHRQPELFVAGALAAGFVLGRFFKSSSQPRSSQSEYEGYDPRAPRGGAQSGGAQSGGAQSGGAQSGGAQSGSARRYGEPSGQRYGEQFNGSRSHNNDRAFESDDYQEANSGHLTTHGLGTGQSIQHKEDLRKSQEFGQGHEKMTTDPTTDPTNVPSTTHAASSFATEPNARTDRKEGERK